VSEPHIITKTMAVIDPKDGREYSVRIDINVNYLCDCGPYKRAVLRAVRGNGKATCLGAMKITAKTTGKVERQWCSQ